MTVSKASSAAEHASGASSTAVGSVVPAAVVVASGGRNAWPSGSDPTMRLRLNPSSCGAMP